MIEKYHIKVLYSKAGLICYSSHRDLIEIIKKSIIRAGLPIAYSKGFNPKPALSFYNPLPLGLSSKCEVMVIHLDSHLCPEDLISSLNQTLPEGLQCIDAEYVKSKRLVKIETTQYTVDPGSNVILNDIDIESACIQRERNGKSIRIKDILSFYCTFSPDGRKLACIDDNFIKIFIKFLLGII